MLEVHRLIAGYGPLPVLHGVSLHAGADEIVGIIGPNGAGKSTLIRALAGLIRPRSSGGGPAVLFEGEPIDGLPAHEIAKRGLAVVPEGSGVFPHMTVLDNLFVGSFLPRARRKRSESLSRVFDLFPRLAERTRQAAGTLSGGERQMLAIGRALMAAPRFLLLDEPSLGIAPKLARAIMDAIQTINREGIGMILVEQNVPLSLGVCHRAYVMENGVIVREGSSAALLIDEGVQRAYLGL